MAKRIFNTHGVSFAAVAAGTQVSVASSYMALKAQSSQLVDVFEIMISGNVSASAVAGFEFTRNSTAATTPTALATATGSDGPTFPSTTALASTVTPFITASTQPTPSNAVTDARLNLGLNTFGGIVRWNAAPTQEWKIFGTAAPGIESMLYNDATALGVTTTANAHIIYEPY